MSRSKSKPYTGSKAVDATCRSHGDCPACKGDREHKHARRVPAESIASQIVRYDTER